MNNKRLTLKCAIALLGGLLTTNTYAQTPHQFIPHSQMKLFFPPNAKPLTERYQKSLQQKIDRYRGEIDLSKILKPVWLQDNISDQKLSKMTFFSWQDKKMVTPAKAQIGGTCWAFAVTAAIESNYLIRYNRNLDLAEQDLVNCGCRFVETCKPAKGPDLLSASLLGFCDNLVKTGLGLEKDTPFKGDGLCNMCGDCNQSKIKPFGIDATGWVEPVNGTVSIEETKRALLKYGPVATGIQLPKNSTFGGYKGGSIIQEKMKDEDAPGAGHIILVVGWDDTKQAWLIKNSWGPGWGDNGFGWLGYGSNRENKSGKQYVIARLPTGRPENISAKNNK